MSVRLYWSGGNRNEVNFGDTISPLIVRHLSGKDVAFADISSCDVAAIGSLLDKIITRNWKRFLRFRFDKIRIWGTGSFGPHILLQGLDCLNIKAVRGKLTRTAFNKPDVPIGDPGLLIDLLVPKVERKYRWGIIPHVVDRNVTCVHALHKDNAHTCIIDLADPDLLAVARKIRSCDFIISSSLHGLITADAFGIPNVWMRVSENVFGGNWKFLDYFSSVDRDEKSPLSLSERSLDLRMLEDNAARVQRGIIEQRQRDLIASFATLNL